MVCKEVLPLIHNYFDGDSAVTERKNLKSHLSTCEACHNYFKQIERTEAMIRSALPATISPTDQLTSRIMDALPPTRKENVFYSWIKRHPAVFVAGVFVVLMLGSFITLWDEGNQLMVKGSGFDQVLIQGNTVIVPEGYIVHGDLIVKGGQIQVAGEVQGNVVVIDGTLNLASTANISGKISHIDQAIDWLWFKMNELFDLFSK